MRTNLFSELATGGKLHLFSIYTDLGDYKRIKWTVNAISKLAGHRWQCSAEMWKLDSLMANKPMRKMLASDGEKADVLIVVVGSLEQRRLDLIEWLDSLMPLDSNRFGLLIGLLGDEDNKAQELDWTAKQLIRCAHRTNRKFIWHWMGNHDLDDTDWLTESVEMLVSGKQTVLGQPMLPEAVNAMPVSSIARANAA
ncbi:MAG TPA: hypothetical protein VMH87_06965 [Pseudomonadales bacterium]|nr:hypothetical protein [Pseudomonadales bacterium]